jgi:hypothetical protein
LPYAIPFSHVGCREAVGKKEILKNDELFKAWCRSCSEEENVRLNSKKERKEFKNIKLVLG